MANNKLFIIVSFFVMALIMSATPQSVSPSASASASASVSPSAVSNITSTNSTSPVATASNTTSPSISVSLTNVTSPSISITASNLTSPTVSITASNVTSATNTSTPTPSNATSITPSISTLSPTRTRPVASPSPFSTPSLIFFTNLLCTVPTDQCCQTFNTSWASLISINSPELVNVITCYADGILTNVLFIQGGNSTYNATQIIQSYFTMGACSTNMNVPCYPQYGTMNSDTWDLVLQINIEGAISNNFPSLVSNSTSVSGNSTSTAGNSTSVATNSTTAALKKVEKMKIKESNDAPHLVSLLLFTLLPLLTITLMLFL